MKVCIIGSNGHINYIIQSLKQNPDLTLVGVAPAAAEDNHDYLAGLATEFNTTYFDSYQQMLDHTQPDVAGIATRYDLNADVSIECLNRGIHCMTEKAIAHSHEKLEAIQQAASATDKQIIGMHAMRYNPEYYAAYQALKSGAIGQPMLISGQKSYKFGFSRPDFYKHRDMYGSTILWVASHAIDWTYWMMGPVASIYALHSNQNNFDYGSCESAAIIALSFQNGGMGTITADFYQPQKSALHGDDQVRIAGDQGIIQVRYGKAFLTTHDKEEQELPLDKGDFFTDFCNELQGRGTCRLSMADTFEVTSLCLLARESADLGGMLFQTE